MKNKLEQQHGLEYQTLAMARQSLRRAKELDLTPEQKEKVMTMIKAAKDQERAGNKSKALNLYIELRKYMEHLQVKEVKDLVGGIDLRNYAHRQIEDLNTIKDSLDLDEDGLKLLENLNQQISIILTPLKNKTHVLKTKDVEILETQKIPDADRIIKALILALDLLPEDIFLVQQFLDQNGHVVRADFGQVGKPGIELKYLLKGQFSEPVGYHSNTCLTIFRKGMDEPMLFETVGYYENGKWLLVGNKTL